jgi:hypothetical protein
MSPRRTKRSVGDEKVKKISIKRLPKKTSFLVQYADGRRIETSYVEIQGNATLYLDAGTREPVLRTEANVSLGHAEGTCTVCGGGTDDQHAHA